MVTKKIPNFAKCLLIIGLALAMVFSVGGAITALADALVIDRSQTSFVVGNFRYYHIQGSATEVAVAWANNTISNAYVESSNSLSMNSGVPDSDADVDGHGSGVIQVPHSVTYSGVPYQVTAVAPTGFRRTGFSEVRLPETITKIGEEAFCACESLEKFVLPCLITEIAPSTFMDCRNLEHVYYSTCSTSHTDLSVASNLSNIATNWKYWSSGDVEGYGIENARITAIGDHAFTSCIKLLSFTYPTSLTRIGKAAFQDCRAFTYIMFVTWGQHSTKNIIIEDYAFADCTAMTLFFFAKNVSNIGAYAFARCERLALYYNGTASDYSGYTTNWRKKHPDTTKTNETMDFVPFRTGYSDISTDPNYPGLLFVTGNVNITLDQHRDKNPVLYTAGGANYYATVLSFATPTTSTSVIDGYQYYNVTKGKLMFPDTVQINGEGTSYPLRVIEQNACLGNTDLREIKFNSNLIQICHYAFYGCSNIEKLDFSAASELKEISYKVFQDENIEANHKLTSLHLPANLLIVGAQAFYNFRGVNDFEIPLTSKLETICQQAFVNLGADLDDGVGTVDLVLPYSLNDKKNKETYRPYRLGVDSNYADNDNAVMREAFMGAKALRSVTITWDDAGYVKDNRIGFGSSCFANCTSLVRFTSSKRLYIMGYSMFAGCSALRELFLSTVGSSARTWTDYPWGNKDGNAGWGKGLFDANTSPNVVIYIMENQLPSGGKNGIPQSNGALWNTNPHIKSNHNTVNFDSTDYRTLPTYPTYFNVNWRESTAVQYTTFDNASTYNISNVLDHLSEPMYAYVASDSKSTLTRAYCKSTDSIDLSAHSLTEIGPGAFAHGSEFSEICPGKQIVLPTSITTIGPYAFARVGGNKLSWVTYKVGSNVTPQNTTTYPSYCILPDRVTNIGRYAFYDHTFSYVEIKGGLSFLGTSAFLGASVATAAFSMNNVTNGISKDGDLVYYTKADQKTLLYLYSSAGTGTKDISGSAIKAIAPRAFVLSKYSEISLPNSLVTIYGGAFYKNQSIQTISLAANSPIKYIGYGKNKPAGSGDFSSLPFDVRDYNEKDGSSHSYYVSDSGAFYGCKKLATFRFSNIQPSAFQKISTASFKDCENLVNLTDGTTEYNYYSYQNSSISPLATLTSGVLDLSPFTEMTSIGARAFAGCNKIQYAHIPAATSLYYGYDSNEGYGNKKNPFSDKTKVLIGEKAKVASKFSDDEARDANRYGPDTIKPETTYFFAESEDDLLATESAVRYWASYEGGYLLLNSRTEAATYFASLS